MVAAIVPWNMPQFLIVTKLVPALLAGCTVVLKPAAESPLDAMLLAEMIDQIDLPPGVVSVLPGDGTVGELLVGHRGVDKVSFTGSTAAGRAVAAACAPNLTKVSLELGGKSAAIVLDGATPEAVAAGVRSASLSNSGQICNALTRVLVPERRHDEYVDALAAEMTAIRCGRSQRSRHPDGPAGFSTPTASRPRLHPGRSTRRRATGHRRQRNAGWTRTRLVRPAHPVRRRRQHHAHCARRDLRASDHRHPLSRRGRRRGDCERLRLRARRIGVDGRHRPGAGDRPTHPDRNLWGQPGLHDGPVRAVRRRQGQRLRSRTGTRRTRRLPRHEVDRRRAGPRQTAKTA